jgi:hypothetical protein
VAEFIRGQLALVAQLERAMIRDRLTAGKLQKKKLAATSTAVSPTATAPRAASSNPWRS